MEECWEGGNHGNGGDHPPGNGGRPRFIQVLNARGRRRRLGLAAPTLRCYWPLPLDAGSCCPPQRMTSVASIGGGAPAGDPPPHSQSRSRAPPISCVDQSAIVFPIPPSCWLPIHRIRQKSGRGSTRPSAVNKP